MTFEADIAEAVTQAEFTAQCADARKQAMEAAIMIGGYYADLGTMGVPDDERRMLLMQTNAIFWSNTLHECCGHEGEA